MEIILVYLYTCFDVCCMCVVCLYMVGGLGLDWIRIDTLTWPGFSGSCEDGGEGGNWGWERGRSGRWVLICACIDCIEWLGLRIPKDAGNTMGWDMIRGERRREERKVVLVDASWTRGSK